MMRVKVGTHRAAVLVVALVMLSMVTFLVVAFVGFARFERASVTASLVRTWKLAQGSCHLAGGKAHPN